MFSRTSVKDDEEGHGKNDQFPWHWITIYFGIGHYIPRESCGEDSRLPLFGHNFVYLRSLSPRMSIHISMNVDIYHQVCLLVSYFSLVGYLCVTGWHQIQATQKVEKEVIRHRCLFPLRSTSRLSLCQVNPHVNRGRRRLLNITRLFIHPYDHDEECHGPEKDSDYE